MSSHTCINVINFYVILSGKNAAELLVGCIFLVGAAGITVEREKRTRRIVHSQTVIQDIFDNIGTAEIACNACINKYIYYITGFYGCLAAVV